MTTSVPPKSTVATVFGSFVGQLETEANLRDEIRDSVKDVDRLSRELAVALSDIHSNGASERLSEIVKEANGRFEEVRKGMEGLIAKVPTDQYYIFHENWKYTVQKLVFAAALICYLEHGRLASLEEIALVIGVKSDRKNGFHLDLEDYLFGLLSLASELSRYCVNRVTAGDYKSPGKIFTFLGELGGGFRLLNLKNSELRRRFDALKYDEKKVEEVIYDLSVRGLLVRDGDAPKEPGTFRVIDEKTRLSADFSSDSTSMQE
ncbi:putative Translin [Hypsibius exemplaris]|uniref:Translin n=1 Tax=Hypsibius exemplaris TaxID=2072580 RepID=A0A1W0WBW2_HYPEX|nr:putative Translin [Hypsibius exemplaris]